MDKTNEWLLISRLSEKVNIPPETIRRYARQYKNYLVMKRGEKQAYLIHESSLDTIKKIRTLLEQGHHHEQVKHILNQSQEIPEKKEVAKETKSNESKLLYMEMLNELQKLAEQNNKLIESLNTIHERMNAYEELLLSQQQAAAVEQVDEQDNEQRDYERKRDEYLMKEMNELQEKRKGDVNSKNGIFTKLFKL